jgi:hypothetical protein
MPLSALSLLERDADLAACCEDETWEPLPGWPHEFSTCGRVRSITRIDAEGRLRLGQMLPQQKDERKGKGYLYATLRDGKRRRKIHVAAGVLEAHRKPKPGPGYEACHSNHVRTENHLWNLSWDTHAANVAASVQRRLEAVTEQAPDMPVPSQEGRFPTWRLLGIRHVRSVTRARSHGTGRLPSSSDFPSISPSVNPSQPSLRNRQAA